MQRTNIEAIYFSFEKKILNLSQLREKKKASGALSKVTIY